MRTADVYRIICCVILMGLATLSMAGQDSVASNQEFSRQWKDVRSKYPLVAMAYLQSLEASAETRAGSATHAAAITTARRLGLTSTTIKVPVCQTCRLPSTSGDLDRYLGCLESRIACLTP